MNTIYAELGSEHHRAIVLAVANGENPKEVAETYGLTKETILRIARKDKKLTPVALMLTDGQTNLPVATVMTSKGFLRACETALRTYKAMFARLELPSWRLSGGGRGNQPH